MYCTRVENMVLNPGKEGLCAHPSTYLLAYRFWKDRESGTNL